MSFILLGVLNSQVSGAAAGAYDLLESTVLTSSASSLTLTGLDSYSDYKHLQVRMTTRTARAVERASIRIYANGDDTLTWSYHSLRGNNGSVTSSGSGGDNFHYINTAGASNTANVFGSSVIDILDFASTTKFKTIRTLTGLNSGTNTALLSEIALHSGAFQSTSSLTSLTFFDSSNADLVAGSRFSLYGVK